MIIRDVSKAPSMTLTLLHKKILSNNKAPLNIQKAARMRSIVTRSGPTLNPEELPGELWH